MKEVFMEREKFDFYKPVKPTNKEIFYALTGEESNPDWNIDILERADLEKIKKVREILYKGLPLSEAGLIVAELPEK